MATQRYTFSIIHAKGLHSMVDAFMQYMHSMRDKLAFKIRVADCKQNSLLKAYKYVKLSTT